MPVPPRISVVLPNFGGGGAERVMVSLANAFASRGVDTCVVVGRAEGPCLDLVSDAVKVVDLGVSRISRALPGLRRHFRSVAPDAVLSALTHANLVTLAAVRMMNRPPRVIVSERNSVNMLKQGSLVKRTLKQRMVRLLYPKANGITLVSRAMQQEFAEFLSIPPRKFDTIYNPVDLDRLGHLRVTPPAHDWLQNKTLPVITAAGRLTRQKDFATLLRAFALLTRDTPARLVIYGEGPERPALEMMVAQLGLRGCVDLPGFTAQLPSELAASDLFVLSSRWEGLPGVLLEALAMEIPVIATDCPTGPDEILEGGRWGQLVPVGDADALAKAMHKALESPSPAPASAVLDRFAPDRIVDQYLSLLLPGRDDCWGGSR